MRSVVVATMTHGVTRDSAAKQAAAIAGEVVWAATANAAGIVSPATVSRRIVPSAFHTRSAIRPPITFVMAVPAMTMPNMRAESPSDRVK